MSGKTVEVAVAVLLWRDKVWIQRRRNTGHLDGCWEFPGGKLQPGESPIAALLRETLEETETALDPGATRLLCVHSHAYPSRRVRIHFFLCRLDSPDVRGKGKWVTINDLEDYRFPPANRPALLRLMARRVDDVDPVDPVDAVDSGFTQK